MSGSHSHHHHHGHDHAGHSHAPVDFGRAFALGIGLNTAFVIIEAAYGFLSNSTVRFVDEAHGQERTVTLVYPHEADIEAGKISVLTPIGAALIGLSTGQTIEFQTPAGGWRSLTVTKVFNQA